MQIRKSNPKKFEAIATGGDLPQTLTGSICTSNVRGGAPFLYECLRVDENGFVLVHRRIRDHWIATNRPVLAIFIQILTRVEWKDDSKLVFVNGCEVKINRGQMTCGRNQMCEWAGVTPQEYRTAICHLKTTKTITIKPTTKFSIISLVNWDKYQNINQQITNKSNNQQPTSNQRATTLEQYNKRTIYNKDSVFKPLKTKNCFICEKPYSLDSVLGHQVLCGRERDKQ